MKEMAEHVGFDLVYVCISPRRDNLRPCWFFTDLHVYMINNQKGIGEHDGLLVEPRTPEREVGGSILSRGTVSFP